MSWDFSTDPEWAQQLEWVQDFVRTECEPIDLIIKESHDLRCSGSSSSVGCGPPTLGRISAGRASAR